MIQDIEKLLNDYVAWLRDKTVLREVADSVEITTPYLDRHNDYVQIYAKRVNGSYLLTDDGNTIDDLEQSGCKLQSTKRQDLLRMTLNGFGVQLHANALEVHASADTFALRKHNLIQSILAVNDMFYLAAPTIASLFYEDVVAWFDLNEIRYTPKVKFTGKSGFDHMFDFVIPKSARQPERVVRAINRPNKDAAGSILWAWGDTREGRSGESRAFAVLNDSEQAVSPSVLDALKNYEVRPILWSKREAARQELAA